MLLGNKEENGEFNIRIDPIGQRMDVTGLGLCPIANFSISSVESSPSTTEELVPLFLYTYSQLVIIWVTEISEKNLLCLLSFACFQLCIKTSRIYKLIII
jgi:hypothetical protein